MLVLLRCNTSRPIQTQTSSGMLLQNHMLRGFLAQFDPCSNGRVWAESAMRIRRCVVVVYARPWLLASASMCSSRTAKRSMRSRQREEPRAPIAAAISSQSPTQVKASYRRWALRVHPDKQTGAECDADRRTNSWLPALIGCRGHRNISRLSELWQGHELFAGNIIRPHGS